MYIPGSFGVDIRAPDVVDHDIPAPLTFSFGPGRGIAQNEPQGLQRGSRSVQRVVTLNVELAADKAGSAVWMLSIPLIRVNPTSAHDLPARHPLMRSRDDFINTKFSKVPHLLLPRLCNPLR